jgi:hypothetical protein
VPIVIPVDKKKVAPAILVPPSKKRLRDSTPVPKKDVIRKQHKEISASSSESSDSDSDKKKKKKKRHHRHHRGTDCVSPSTCICQSLLLDVRSLHRDCQEVSTRVHGIMTSLEAVIKILEKKKEK